MNTLIPFSLGADLDEMEHLVDAIAADPDAEPAELHRAINLSHEDHAAMIDRIAKIFDSSQ